MRCPKCTERNSVAARKCNFCGEKFKRKPLPLGAKLTLGGIAVAVTVSVFASSVLPNLVDPAQNLARAAKQLSNGPKNPEQAHKIRKDFDVAVRNYLLRFGDDSSDSLRTGLQKILSSHAFEVHVIDLPKGLRLVEIDMVLQASDFIVMKGSAGTKIFPIPELEVFDDARLLQDAAGPMLAIIGHSGGPPPHTPQIRTYALLPDYLTDETDRLVPLLRGEGTAKFLKNSQDIALEFSLISMAKSDNIQLDISRDETVRPLLTWKDAKYTQKWDKGASTSTALYTVAECVRHPERATGINAQILGSAGMEFVKTAAVTQEEPMKASYLGVKNGVPSYRISTPSKNIVLSMRSASNCWTVSSIRGEKVTQPQTATVTSTTSAAPGEQVALANPVAPPPVAPVVAKPPAVQITPVQTRQPVVVPHETRQPVLLRNEPRQPVVEVPERRRPAGIQTANQNTTQQKPAERTSTPDNVATRRDSVNAARPDSMAPTEGSISTTINAGYVKLRNGPSLSAGTLDQIAKGTPIKILGKSDGWYRVRVQGKEGYVYGGLVNSTKPASAYTTAVVTRSRLVTNGRRTVGNPQVGDRVVVLGGVKNNKYKVQLSNGTTGYVDKDAIDVAVDAPEFGH